jgi:hypothetical protein
MQNFLPFIASLICVVLGGCGIVFSLWVFVAMTRRVVHEKRSRKTRIG